MTDVLSSLREHATSGSAASPLNVPRLLQVHLGSQVFTMQRGLTYVIGSDRTCNIEVADRLLAPKAAAIRNDQLTVYEPGLHLNTREVTPGSDYTLRDGDVLQLGTTNMTITQLSAVASQAQAQPHTHEQRNQAIAGGAIGAAGVPHTSIQDKEADALSQRTVTKQTTVVYGNGLPYGQKFLDAELDRFSPQGQQHSQIVQPGHSATLPNGIVVAAGAHPVLVQDATTLAQEHAIDPNTGVDAITTQVGSTTIASTPMTISYASKHHSPVQVYEQQMGTREIQGTSEQAQQPIVVILAPNLSSGTTVAAPVIMSLPIADSSSHDADSKFSTSELVAIFRDMLDVAGLKVTDGGNAALPSMIVLLPERLRRTMNSSHLKQWLRLAESERHARISGSTISTAAGSQDVKQAYANPTDSISESDLAYGLLSLVAPDMDAHVKSQPTYTPPTALESGVTKNHFRDDELTDLWADMADLSGDRLEAPARLRLPVMLHHLPASYRAGFDSTAIKSWIRSAHERRQERQMASTALPGSNTATAAGEQKSLSELDLVYSLVGLPWWTAKV